MKRLNCLLSLIIAFSLSAIYAEAGVNSQEQDKAATIQPIVYDGFPETFESGSKTKYKTGSVTLGTGSWHFTDALIGNRSGDKKNGSKAARIRNTGKIRMNFDLASGADEVSIAHAKYGSDGNSDWELWYSTDGGANWQQTGSKTSTTTATLTTSMFAVKISGNIRFEIRKVSGGTNRINYDDFSVTQFQEVVVSEPTTSTEPPPQEITIDHIALGNPSNAETDVRFSDNYLHKRSQYVLSFHRYNGTPNWVSWHLDSSTWIGDVSRFSGRFITDTDLPEGWYSVKHDDYTNSGYDRGHMCPSADRTATVEDNKATFYISNIIGQTASNNRGPWKALESYCRDLVKKQNNELYIVSGGYGRKQQLADCRINIPTNTWKVIVIIEIGINDLSRVDINTRVIAVDIPNTGTGTLSSWDTYRISVDSLEEITDYDFLSNVSVEIQKVLESKVDNGPVRVE